MLEDEIQQRPDDSRVHSSLGIAYAGLGRKEAAINEKVEKPLQVNRS